MKATGIVRRIDDLGRVVIPKEIRRTLKIREGMPMEIFTDSSGEVILKKYSPVGEMEPLAQSYAETLSSMTGYGIAVTDTEQIIALAGPAKKELMKKAIAPQIDECISTKEIFRSSKDETLLVSKDIPAAAVLVYPIVSMGDAMGSIILIKGEKSPPTVSDEVFDKTRSACMFLASQLDD